MICFENERIIGIVIEVLCIYIGRLLCFSYKCIIWHTEINTGDFY